MTMCADAPTSSWSGDGGAEGHRGGERGNQTNLSAAGGDVTIASRDGRADEQNRWPELSPGASMPWTP